MGNGVTKVSNCFASPGDISSRRHDIVVHLGDPLHEGLGHSFCYIRPDPGRISTHHHNNSKLPSDETTTFKSISGASVSANTSSTPSTVLTSDSSTTTTFSSGLERASTFESSESFASIPLQPVPRSQPLQFVPGSGPIERGFLSGPIERGFCSGPIDRAGIYSGPIDAEAVVPKQSSFPLQRSLSHGSFRVVEEEEENNKTARKKGIMRRNIIKKLKRVLSKMPKKFRALGKENPNLPKSSVRGSGSSDPEEEEEEEGEEDTSEFSIRSQSNNNNLEWAQGKAGEDRVHIVISEEHGWVFVGIYDGFNGPDAPDYLMSNLYNDVQSELKGLLWNEKDEEMVKNRVNHFDVLRALSRALRKTEESYFDVADKMAAMNPELALMGSCVLAMLMKGEDVYLLNVGDSRAVLAQRNESMNGTRKSQDLGMITEEIDQFDDIDGDEFFRFQNLNCLQLTMDHSTSIDKEVQRIKKEHPDDPNAVMNDRVKGYLKVTRAFGVGFLKQQKWNDLLFERFRIDYVGNSPYVTCFPSLYHHRLSSKDRFLILSSDGLYQYFTNEQAVSEVESFLFTFPEGDPAQHLIEEVLFRAAKKAGMDFHELLDIPQGDRRRYHDDVSVIIISFEGRIWRSSM
ncbi:Probable protein phosphatase 2C 4 [Linum grandiflorum]